MTVEQEISLVLELLEVVTDKEADSEFYRAAVAKIEQEYGVVV